MGTSIRGRCLCGAIRFEIQPPTLASAHCHCEYCRRAHGAAFVTWLTLRSEQFSLVSGHDLLQWYGSSAQSRRAFCSTCGSTLLFQSAVAPGETHVASAALIDPPDQVPRAHVFFDGRVDWVTVSDELPTYDSDGPELNEYRVIPALPE